MKKFIRSTLGLILCMTMCLLFSACSLTPAKTLTAEESNTLLTECISQVETKEKVDIYMDMGILGYTHTIITPERSYSNGSVFGIRSECWYIEEESTLYEYSIATMGNPGEETKTYTKKPSEGITKSEAGEFEVPESAKFVSGQTKDGVTTLVYTDNELGEEATITYTIKNNLLIEMKATNQAGTAISIMKIKYDDEVSVPELPTLDDNNQEIVWNTDGGDI